MTMQFRAAEKARAKLRLALIGPSGSGKTYTALALAQGLAGDGRFCVIDTEHGSASLYADLFRFDVLELDEFSPDTYVRAIRSGEAAGYAVIVVDSLSHAWEGTGGALDMADRATKRSNSGNSYMAWRDVTPHHNALVEAMVGSRAHLIATMRVKTEYVIEEQNGKKVPRRVGLAPVQRAGMEYEFGVVGDLNREHELIISKTRIPSLDGAIIAKPGAELAQTMLTWLDAGTERQPVGVGRSPSPLDSPPPERAPEPNGTTPENGTQGATMHCCSELGCALPANGIGPGGVALCEAHLRAAEQAEPEGGPSPQLDEDAICSAVGCGGEAFVMLPDGSPVCAIHGEPWPPDARTITTFYAACTDRLGASRDDVLTALGTEHQDWTGLTPRILKTRWRLVQDHLARKSATPKAGQVPALPLGEG